MLPQGVVIPSKEHFCERVNFVLSTDANILHTPSLLCLEQCEVGVVQTTWLQWTRKASQRTNELDKDGLSLASQRLWIRMGTCPFFLTYARPSLPTHTY